MQKKREEARKNKKDKNIHNMLQLEKSRRQQEQDRGEAMRRLNQDETYKKLE